MHSVSFSTYEALTCFIGGRCFVGVPLFDAFKVIYVARCLYSVTFQKFLIIFSYFFYFF